MSSEDRRRRVADSIHRLVAEMLQCEVKNYDLTRVTVLRCEITGDLREAAIRYSVLGDSDERARCQDALTRVAGFLQHRLGEELTLYRAPHLTFTYDTSVEEGLRLDQLFSEIDRERKKND